MNESVAKPVMPRGLYWGFGLGVLAIVAGGLWFYHAQETQLRQDVERNLSAIVKLKAEALADWRRDALEDAAHVAENPLLVSALARGLPALSAAERETLRVWMESFRKHARYEDILLTDAAGQILFSLTAQTRDVDEEEKAALLQASNDGAPHLSKLFLLASRREPRVSAVAPVRVGAAVQGVLLVADPAAHLYPLLQAWPIPSRSAEALLVRREGEQVLFLNDLRHQSNTALRLSIPLTHTEVPAVLAVLGRQGVVPGRDYRGVPVLSALTAIPDSSWFLVVKEDEEEALAAWRGQARLILGGILGLLLGLLTVLWLIWQQSQKRHYRVAYQAEVERQALRHHYELFIKHANDIIILTDGRQHIIEANDRALETYGYTREEMLGMPICNCIPPELRATFEERTRLLTSHGEFRGEALHQRKDGSCFPVESSARVIEVGGVTFVQAIIRDITERKAQLEQIERMNRLYLALSQVNQSIVRAQTRAELFAEMCRVLIEFGGFKMAWIGLVNPVTKQVEVAAHHGDELGYLEDIKIYADDRPEGRGPTGLAIREDRPVMSKDFLGDERTQPWQAKAARAGIFSSASFPLHLSRQACGALTVYAGETDFFHEREVALLVEAAMDISYAMEKLLAAEQHALTDAQLRASETQFHTLFNAMQEMVVLHELLLDAAGQPVDYRILDCNPAFSSITGITKEKAVGALASELFDVRPPPYLEQYARAVQTGCAESIETFFAPMGKNFFISAFRYAPGRFATVTMDTTERKRAEDALREGLLFRREAEKIAKIGAWKVNPRTDYLYWTEGVYEILEAPLDYKPGLEEGLRFYTAESIPVLREALVRALEKGTPFTIEVGLTTMKGRSVWSEVRGLARIEEDGQPYIIGTFQDITERKQAEVTLQRSKEDWENIFQAIGQPTAILSPEHGVMTANRALLSATGKTLEELRGLKCWQVFHGRDVTGPMVDCPLQMALRSGHQEVAEVECQMLGGTHLMSCTPVKNAAGQVERVIHIATNITEFKRLHQAFLQAQKMETVGKLAGGVAHDFNNILQTILGYSEMLLKSTPPEDERHRDLKEIHSGGERAAGLTRQLLAFSRKQMLQPRVCDLNEIITNVGRMLARMIGEDVTLKLELTPTIKPVQVDVGQLEQVLMNLAVNARDAMPKGGQFFIRTSDLVLASEDLPMHPEGRAGRFVCMEVSDNGCGMSKAVQAKLFEPFFTTKPQGKGTGLGLATVHGIVKQHEGWTTVYSEEGLGTTFKIHLPAVEDAEPAAAVEVEAHIAPGRNENILLIEDDPQVRYLTCLLLKRHGYRVTDVGLCAEALAAFSGGFDLVLSDMVLPDGNGLEMVRQLQRQCPRLRCVLTSGYADIHERWPEIEKNSWVFLHKPFNRFGLLRAVAGALTRV